MILSSQQVIQQILPKVSFYKNISRILFFGLLTLILIICVKVLVDIIQLSSLSDRIKDISQNHIPDMQRTTTARSLVSDLETVLLEIITSEVVTDAQKARKSHIEEQIRQSLATHRHIDILDPEQNESVLLDELSHHYDMLEKATERILNLIQEGNFTEAKIQFSSLWEALHHQVFDSLDELLLYEMGVAAAYMHRMKAGIEPAKMAAIALASVTIVFTIGLGLMVIFSLTRPVASLLRAIERIREGETSNIQTLPNSGNNPLTREFTELLEWLHGSFEDACHEIRTSVTVIRGEAEVTLRNPPKSNADYRETLTDITDVAEHLGYLLDDLVFLGRAQIGHIKYDMKPVDLIMIVEDVTRQSRNLAVLKGIKLKLDLDGNENGIIHGDSQRLRQLLLIFIDNAIKYTAPNGMVHVAASIKDDQIVVSVADSGQGIPQEHLPYIFKRFYRIPGARESESGLGTGLGLAIAKSIVQVHRGEISVRSKMNEGTTFTVCFSRFHSFQ